MAKRLPERKLNPWGPAMYVAQGERDGNQIYYATEFEMIVAVRLNLVPIGVEILGAGNGWAWVKLELPAGFARPEDGEIAHEPDLDMAGMSPGEDG